MDKGGVLQSHYKQRTRGHGFGYWACCIFGVFVAIVGLLMVAGGVWLILLGGSWYYAVAGLGLLIAGVLMARMQINGVWLYWLVFVGTISWALWEVGLDMWALMPRVLAPAVLAVVALLFIPVVRRHHDLVKEHTP